MGLSAMGSAPPVRFHRDALRQFEVVSRKSAQSKVNRIRFRRDCCRIFDLPGQALAEDLVHNGA